jgi:hypothetical protein
MEWNGMFWFRTAFQKAEEFISSFTLNTMILLTLVTHFNTTLVEVGIYFESFCEKI